MLGLSKYYEFSIAHMCTSCSSMYLNLGSYKLIYMIINYKHQNMLGRITSGNKRPGMLHL
jgi:hypothetical protein